MHYVLYTIHYDAPEIERKSLVHEIGGYLNEDVRHLGVPSLTYKIGFCRLNADVNLVIDTECDNLLVGALLEYLGKYDFEGSIQNEEVNEHEQQTEARTLNVSLSRGSFTDEALKNLKKLINFQKGLIKRAFGISELPREMSDEIISFQWQLDISDSDAVKSYTHFTERKFITTTDV